MNTDVIIGAATALAGAGVTGLIQYVTFARSARTRQRARIGDAADAYGDALINYRRPIYAKVDDARKNADPSAGRDIRWEAKSEVTRSLKRLLRVSAGARGAAELARVAREAATVTFALNDVASDVVDAVRGRASAERLTEAEEALREVGDEARRLDEQLLDAAVRATGGA
ncbi:hypothetical protein ADK70_12580 [Streptomyces rimosus subsp. pseudoverticillatus]|uniref:hypothetical protein n=1 Tax=Streptomyces rimosus TaxID=1927 RepID=UPI0006B29828|nr:hypothetical protein [Streptomyces rimosus]KOT94505.1 hypothetical protein ADK70_12580 [Streptomyces rimosus subsp. pseudoverticillatus]